MTSQEGSSVVEHLGVLESDDADDGRHLRLVDDLPRPEFRGRGRSARVGHFDSCPKFPKKKLVSRVLREEGTCGGCTYGQHVGGRLVVDDLSGPLSRLFALQGGRTHRLVDGVVKAPGSPSMQ